MDNLFNVNVLDEQNIKTSGDFINDIIPELESILRYTFPESKQKQSIRIHGNNRINFACPLCGDSGTDAHKKRGNIILDQGRFQNMFKCHNCGAYMSIDKFFKRFNKNLSLGTIEYISQNKQFIDNVYQDSSLNMLFDIEFIEQFAISRDIFRDRLNLIEITKDNNGGLYLIKRNQFKWDRFLYDNANEILYVLNLTPSSKIIGVQTKPLKRTADTAKYKTYKLSGIYSNLLFDNKEIPEDIDIISMFFNILLVNYSRPIIVTEGPMDAFLINNAIATCGANKSIPIDYQFYYMFDDDKVGRDHAFKKLNNSEYVFMWDKFKKQINLPYKNKWDYNDVVNYTKMNNITLPNILEYFSNDSFDIIDI